MGIKELVDRNISMDEEFLLDDITDTLMERYADIGTNIRDDYPRTHRVGNKIYLCDRNGKARFVLTLTKGQ